MLYIHNRQCVPPFLNVDLDIPILPCGDFNVDTITNPGFVDFIKNTFNLDCVSNTRSSATLGGTCIDVTFTRYITAETLRYILFFSYHRPVINRVCPSVCSVSKDKMLLAFRTALVLIACVTYDLIRFSCVLTFV
jgi:hypothetical protein